MNREDRSSIPDELRERLARESPDERGELERVWRMLEDAETSYADAPSADATWSAIQRQLDADAAETGRVDRRPARPARTARRRAWKRWGLVAASVAILLLAGALFWRQPVEVAAPPGEHVTTTLPDGSSVELNSGTTLTYPRRFSTWPFVPAAQRTVALRGEAFFDVQSGERPFVVETFNARVEVLGTQFNVRARADTGAEETRVTLTSGQVRLLAAEQPERAVVLEDAGQSSRVTASDASPTAPQADEVDRALAWREQGFAVSDWPLSAIFAELERRYDVNIRVDAPAALADSMTLYYPQHTEVETIIHDIAVAKDLTYRATSQGYAVESK